MVSAVGHEIDNALSDLAADLRAPTLSAAAELVSAQRGEVLETVKAAAREMAETIRDKIERARLLVKPFGLEDLEYRFRVILQPRLIRLDEAKEELLNGLSDKVNELRRRLELSRTALEAVSPAAIMERGFAMVINEESGEVLRRSNETTGGDRLRIRLMDVTVKARTE